jgi:uncharacterized protein DUF5655
MALTPAQMVEAVTRNMQKNTGKTADEWRALLKKSGPKGGDEKAKYAWFREQGVGHVAAKVLSGGLEPYQNPGKLVDAQYAGAKKELRPIYEAVLKAAKKLGKDVVERPCKTYVPLHRSKTFAVVKPERTRVDIGFCLDKSVKSAGRLTVAKHLGSDRVTHKIELSSPKDIDSEVVRWLKAAYEQA